MSEQDLVQRVIAGNGAAREAFYDRYNKLAWSIIIEIIDGEEDRKDLFQVFFAHVSHLQKSVFLAFVASCSHL